MGADARATLLERMPTGGVCAEIGVWEGDFSARILEACRPERLHLIDPWKYEAHGELSRSRYGGPVGQNQGYIDSIYDGVLRRFGAQIATGQVVVHRMGSEDAVSRFPDDSFDWVYVDGNHSFEHVLADLRQYGRKVRPGGYLTGDDYGQTGYWWGDGVERAVEAFLAEGKYELVAILDDQFILRRP